ncbi:MAG: NDP-sugar synthase [Pseudomonadota bacterium]
MKAMILAAGLGTRLRPLTEGRPKALIPVVNRPIISIIIEYLKKHGINQMVVNTHHHQQQIVDYLDCGTPFGIEIDVRVEPEILGTGGGIKNTLDFWDTEPFIVVNSDILTNIDIGPACEQHRNSGALATLILHDYGPFNQIQIDHRQNLIDIASKSEPGRLAFTGIHIIDPELLSHIPEKRFSDIIDCYRKLIQSRGVIRAYLSKGHYWRDIGTVSDYVEANRDLLEKEPYAIGTDCHIDPSVNLDEWAVVGERCHLEKDAEIKRSILWEGVRIKKGIRVIDGIVTSFAEVNRDVTGEIY